MPTNVGNPMLAIVASRAKGSTKKPSRARKAADKPDAARDVAAETGNRPRKR